MFKFIELIKIKDRIIHKNSKPFLVAEAGINHNGKIENALKMIQVAKRCGLDAIKFQTFKTEEFVNGSHQKYTYYSQGKKITESMFDMFKRTEFSKKEWKLIKNKCDEEKIIFFSTPQNKTDLDLLLELGIPAIKVGSDDSTNFPLLKDYSKTGLPIIVSSGMSDLTDICKTLESIGTFEGYPTVLLVTTSQYPTPVKDVNLLKIKTLEKLFEHIPIGFSDHTRGTLASTLALALGACFFEKHFTLDHNLPGPDHWFSEDPSGLESWAKNIKNSKILLGSSIITPTKKEEEMKKMARRSIVSLREIKKGDKFSYKNIGLRRPGIGFNSEFFGKIKGLAASKNISKNKIINSGDIE